MPELTPAAPDLVVVLPEIVLVATAVLVLLVDAFLGRDKTATLVIALSGALASGVVALGLFGQEKVSFAGMVALDDYAVFFKVLFAVAAALTILMSPRYLEAHDRHLSEYYAVLLLAVVGMNVMAASRDFLAFYVGLELMAVSSYLLAGFFRQWARSNEAALKYLVTGAFASALTLYGISLVYGLTGSTNYQEAALALTNGTDQMGLALATALIAAGMGFKVSVVPFHMWTPDVYEGAPTPIAGFFSVGPKAAGFAAIIMVFHVVLQASAETWSVLFIVLALVTMFIGNVLALVQQSVKRMLAYSSIAHVGYLLAGLGALGRADDTLAGQAMLLYLAAYTFMNLGAFAVLVYLKTGHPGEAAYSLDQIAGLGRRTPLTAIVMTLFMFSLTGIPGTAGFIGKFYLFTAVVRADLVWLAVIGVIFSAVSAYYYLRVVVYMFFRESEKERAKEPALGGSMAAALAATSIGVVLIGLLPPTVWDSAVRALENFTL